MNKKPLKTLSCSLREYLWLSHGHLVLYGDDGEMQCSECAKFGVIDYKRQPLNEIINAAIKARQDINLKEQLKPNIGK